MIGEEDEEMSSSVRSQDGGPEFGRRRLAFGNEDGEAVSRSGWRGPGSAAVRAGPMAGERRDPLNTLVDFYGTNGALPYAGLLEDATNGIFYGTTFPGRAYNQGTVFAVTLSGLTNLASFDGTNNGARPTGGLIFGSDGYLYGRPPGGC